MARKSRYDTAELSTIQKKSEIFNVAGYARLSEEDRGEAASLENQELMLRKFIEQSPDMKLCQIYSDNGLTGTNFDRPAFESLISAIKRGVINCIVVKDLSRFGRDYIEAGNYIETIFPKLNIRFISINDNFDSFNPRCWDDGMSIALKNIINAAYAKDISFKMRTAYDAKRRRGDYTGSKTPFGYTRLPEKKSQLIVDEQAAAVVRDIFRWRIEGLPLRDIAKQLDAAGIPNPMHYAYIKGFRNDSRFAKPVPWDVSVVSNILGNVVYTGNLELGKKIAVNMGTSVKQPKENWIVNRNTHEPIISQEDFDVVAKIIQKTTEHRREQLTKRDRPPIPDNIFKNLAFCAVCGHTFNRDSRITKLGGRAVTFTCLTCRNRNNGSERKRFRYEVFKSIVFEIIKLQLNLSMDSFALVKQIRMSDPVTQRLEEQRKEVEATKQRITHIEGRKERLLCDYYDGILSKTDYQLISKQREDELQTLNKRLESLLAEQEPFKPDYWDRNKHIAAFEQFRSETELSREMLEALVKRIEVDEI